MTSARLNCPEDAARRWGHGKVIPRCQIQSHTSTLPLPLYQLKLQLEWAWTYLNTQHKLYCSMVVKPPSMKSISDPRFALPRLPPVLRSSVVPLVPHREQSAQLRPWQYCDLVHTTHKTPRCSIIMFGNLACSTISAWSKDGFYLRRDPRAG